MRDHSHHIQLTREEAVRRELAAVDGLPGGFGGLIDRVALTEAAGRVLAHDVAALAQAPTCLTCLMDSIAVHFDDFAGALAGGSLPSTEGWERGRDWEFANTGTAMPEGFDAAIVVEHVRFSADGGRVLAVDAAPSARFAGTKPAGSDLAVGEVLARAGQVVTPDVAARIAAGNVSTVAVVRRPRVAFIPTGGELQEPGSPFVARGKVVETNSLLARMKVEAWGGVFVPFQTIEDDPAAIRAALEEACSAADIVVLNAGSSKGSHDYSCEVLDEMGRVICHQTNHGPGHHSSYAMVDGTPVVGISGPSAGASPTMDFYLRPLMRRFLGLDPVPAKLPARLAAPFPAGRGHGPKSVGAAAAGAAGAAPLGGERRPLEQSPDGFFSIRFINLRLAADGVLEALPIAGGPFGAAAATADGYYMMPSGPGITPPAPGDVIMVESRR